MKPLAVLLLLLSVARATTTLAWDEHSDPSVIGFILYRQLDESAQRWVTIPGGRTTSAKILTTPGEEYTAYLTAFNEQGLESLPSNSITWTAEGSFSLDEKILVYSWWFLIEFDAFPGRDYVLQRYDFEENAWLDDGDSISTPSDSPILRLRFIRKKTNLAMFRLRTKSE